MEDSFIMPAVLTAGPADYERMASTFGTISIVLFVLAAVCLAFGIFAFITFRIPSIIGDLTGRNARKSIEQMRESNEKGRKKSYRSHPVASARGTITEPIEESRQEKRDGGSKETYAGINATIRLNYNASGTEILGGSTEVLSEDIAYTALNEIPVKMKMIQDIVLIHTEEVI